jgi:hypothetical protein
MVPPAAAVFQGIPCSRAAVHCLGSGDVNLTSPWIWREPLQIDPIWRGARWFPNPFRTSLSAATRWSGLDQSMQDAKCRGSEPRSVKHCVVSRT